MRAAIAEHGLEARIGVNTGEVVVGGEGETLVTGDAVNVAARLEQAARAGEILIGRDALLVRDAVRVEAVEPLALKGKSEPVEAYRLLEVIGDAAPLARHLETPLVGRERERQRLWRDYEDAVADRTCRLFTLLGPAGIGKSRLVADFLERVGDSADVLRGRCLSYGEGITYWPLVEILIAIGVDPETSSARPARDAARVPRAARGACAERPQVVVIDDLQWAEPVFVDLVEHIADLSRDAPIFLLCIARTELLDARPGWGGGKLNATRSCSSRWAEECAELMERSRDASLDASCVSGSPWRRRETRSTSRRCWRWSASTAATRDRRAADDPGSPAGAIDSLDGDVRVVMERGAVEGEVFHRGAVAELRPIPVRPAVESHLATLVRKELIRSTRRRSRRTRASASATSSSATRPTSRCPRRRAPSCTSASPTGFAHDLVERDEIVGYHLEQAHRYRAELDRGSARLPDRASWPGGAARPRGLRRRGQLCAVAGILAETTRRRRSPRIAFASGSRETRGGALAPRERALDASPAIRASRVVDGMDAVGSGAQFR